MGPQSLVLYLSPIKYTPIECGKSRGGEGKQEPRECQQGSAVGGPQRKAFSASYFPCFYFTQSPRNWQLDFVPFPLPLRVFRIQSQQNYRGCQGSCCQQNKAVCHHCLYSTLFGRYQLMHWDKRNKAKVHIWEARGRVILMCI